ncbi:basement membrane-specific heparan sulfate proteoglycan core protein isoform X9 [Homalodisca vitripennis]|uniref:basement membrane-specific heparan sulfate proteoglycan core protein isoform X9 n=1 Tax=Homalodisca vitripennis TaxID=197043 RepID=UPI001EEAA2FB|nr:basement membrane-specific heparan sulfate proteoglycan core protein isoform X9 [Homalodisca vitripennis]
MAARGLVVLGCLAFILLFPTNAEFLNEDLVFEEPASPPRWRRETNTRTVYNQEINSLDSPLLQDSSYSDSESGLWNSAKRVLHRVRRGLFDWFDSSKESTTTTIDSAAATSSKEFTSEPETSHTSFRETRSTDDFNRTTQHVEYLSSLVTDDDDFDIGGTSGDSSGDLETDLGTGDFLPGIPSTSSPYQRVYHRVTISVHEPYRDELADRNSDSFKEFSDQFSQAVDNLLENDPRISGTQKSGVINIERNDDIPWMLVVLDISSEGFNKPEEVEHVLRDHVEKFRRIGSYAVSPDHFDFRNFGQLNTTTSPTTTTTTEAALRELTTAGPLPGSIDRCRADDKVRCIDGSTFICDDQKCDGRKDCPDGDDEIGCQIEDECGLEEFMCDLTRCIPLSQVCDGVYQCIDKLDEENCPDIPKACTSEQFECRDGSSCIALAQYCDGRYDCRDYSDESNCSQPNVTRQACTSEQFECRDGSSCIALAQYCDGRYDCRDYSDESNCSQPNVTRQACTSEQFECRDGSSCIALAQYCDGRYDCRDYSDESNCSQPNVTRQACTSEQFQCGDGTCITLVQFCDGHNDCADNSDELSCPRPACKPDQFECYDGSGCVSRTQYCDNRPDCRDNSDEYYCPDRQVCTPEQFECRDGSGCVNRTQYCDSIHDCRDHSDEENCIQTNVTTQACDSVRQFECDDQSCLEIGLRCNGRVDCPHDGSDERDCPNTSTLSECRPSEFRCRNGVCLDYMRKCDRKSDCPDNTDEQTCPCTSDEFKCENDFCIPKTQRCDGLRHCNDGSDEFNCNETCRVDQFHCKEGGCIDRNLLCNRIYDCRDGSDENNCDTCKTDDFYCNDGRCLPMSVLCNGRNDCRDGEDELRCPNRLTCQPHEFQCRDRSCIDYSLKCNDVPDCADYSDEDDCEGELAPCQSSDFTCKDGSCIPKGKRCDGKPDCPDAFDELDCSDGNPVHCMANEFRCNDGSCIQAAYRCDNVTDCADRSDELNCRRQSCGTDEFTCGDGSCVHRNYVCDGARDCKDGTDERNCPVPCHSDEFSCDTSRCIPNYKKCDRFQDCVDNTDEINCGCTDNEFRCRDGSCIPYQRYCDGRVRDCQDGSDEQDCPPVICSYGWFRCNSGQCIPQHQMCDMRTDCLDGSDEQDCRDYYFRAICSNGWFRCNSGQCIPQHQMCDMRTDCLDGSDEQECRDYYFRGSEVTQAPPSVDNRVSCPYGQFACQSGDQCVPQSAHCDNNYDCRDYSDENNCAGNPEGLNLKTYPNDQIIKAIEQGREVVFQCRDEGPLRASVRWTRGNGLPLPPGSRDIKGRLEMPNIQLEHEGSYVCEAMGFSSATPGSRASVYLKVEPFEQLAIPTRKVCEFNEATCSNGDCIPKNNVCDGRYDCTDGSDEMRCNPHGCEPNEFRCDNKKCVQKTWLCDSDDDCGDGSDEKNCQPSPPGSNCQYNEYQCARQDQCIPKAFHCDMEVDCQDGSDEFGCSKAEIQKPPPSMVVKQPGETFTITCTAVGVPTPEVVWRLNWGHIPPKCQTTSVNGYGTLTCPNIMESDQGAYSCEALNNRGSTFAIPDTILVVKPDAHVCTEGSFNELAKSPEECIPCFCFGKSTSCRSANLFIFQLPPPLDTYTILNVYMPPSGGVEIRKEPSQLPTSVFGRSGFKISLTDNNLKPAYYSTVYPYFALPESYLGSQLTSYGGYIKYTVKSDGSGSPLPQTIPDIILSGNGYTLVYKGPPINPRVENNIAIRFFPGNWYRVHPESRIEYPATRQDLMMTLQQVDHLLIRTQYFSDDLETTITDIIMDSAAIRNYGQGKAAYVEQCDCPLGYSGYSCEKCDKGFMHQPTGQWLGSCVAPEPCPSMYFRDPRDNQCHPCSCPHTDKFGVGCGIDSDMNITCTCPPGFEGRRCEKCSEGYIGNPLLGQPCVRRPVIECDPAGSKSTQRDPRTGTCSCKEYATGPTCNQCKPNTFNLASGNQFGCINCFCMGINTTCTSSDLYRTQVVAAFTRDNQDFKLAEANRLSEPITDIQVNPAAQEIYFQQFNPGTYYWVLPSKFLFNKVTSYGGYLKYTVRYIPVPGGYSYNNAPDVEIVSDNGVRLVYYHSKGTQPEPNRPVTVEVPLLEQYWARIDGAPANREQLLMGLAELSNILIKATYTTNTQEAALLSVSLDTATDDRNTGQNRAVEVELCYCPQGYRGTSCEECDAGYTRMEEGLYLGVCEPCSCNGYSNECDPDTGRCLNCQGNTMGEKCDQCVPGYGGSPGTGVPCTPEGTQCNCDPRGSTSQTCEQGNQCTCKTNVIGQSCSECRKGTFDLSEANIDGCIECYCSGVSSECQSSNYYREAIPMQIIDGSHGFLLTDPSRQFVIQDGFILNPAKNEIGYDFSNNQRQQRLFWSLPPQFTGNKILSYGGNLNFSRSYTALQNYSPSFDTDIILIGPTLSVYWTDDILLSPNITRTTSIPLRENKWRRLDQTVGQKPASRADLMSVLSNLQAILVRATYPTYALTSFLSDVSLDTAVSQRTGRPVASEVEVCRCPQGHRGSSCESCSAGYYQDFDKSCKKCPCNNNEEYCVLGAQQQVICTCRTPYSGLYCDRTINSIMMRLYPEQVSAAVGQMVRFSCSYNSSEKLMIEFSEQLYPSVAFLMKMEGNSPAQFHYWGGEKNLDTIIQPEHRMVSCYVKNAYGQILGTLSSMIYPDGGSPRPPPSQPTISISITEPTVIVIEAGKDITFRCTGRSLISSNPIGIEWSKENGYLPIDRAIDDKRGLLIIKDAQASDSGNYICTASDGYTFVTERATLTVGGLNISRPVVSVSPRVVDVREGEPVEFRCEATGVPTPNVQWVRDRSSRLPSQSSFASGVFRIPYASLVDEGLYTCTANNSAGDDSETVSLYVRSAPPTAPPTTAPPTPIVRLTVQPQDYQGYAGDTVRLECIASSPRNIRLQWSRLDGALSPNARDADGVFTIYNAQPGDSGYYTCTAVDWTTGVVQQEVRARVNVNSPSRPQPTISIEPPRQTVPQGTTAELRCVTNEGPIQWSKAGDTLPANAKIDGNILRIERIQVLDRGVYVCQVEGPAGLSRITAIIEVERREVPAIELFPKSSQTVTEGGSALFQCRVLQGIPEPSLHWSRVDGTPLSRHVEQLPTGVLRFNSVARSDEGQYLCTADNSQGSATTVAVLEVQSLPKITITPVGQSIKISLGQVVRLDCQAYGYPQPIVVWSKHQPGYSFYEPKSITEESPQGAVYEIRGATHDDEGSYTCSARNAAGQVEERIQLIVSDEQTTSGPSSGRGDIPSGSSSGGVYILPDEDFTVPLGGHVTIRCVAQAPQQIYLIWKRRDQRPLGPSAQTVGGELYIQQAQYSDSGDYSCEGVDTRGEMLFSAVAHLRVVEPMQIRLDPERQVVRPGDNARITCSATGEQPITINWQSANNQPLPASVRVSGGVIEFLGIQESDAGRYLCKASNMRGILEATADVIVNENNSGSLRAVDRNPSAMEGTNIQLRCDTRDNQRITWSRENGPLPSRASIQGHILQIDNLQLGDAGRYICQTDIYGQSSHTSAQDYIDLRVELNPCTLDEFSCKNRQCIPLLQVCDGILHCSDGSDEATCQIRPGRDLNDLELKIEPSNREAHYGETVDLRCIAAGPQGFKLYWSRADGGNLPANARQTGDLLRLTSATPENTGTYRCTAILNNNRYHEDYYLIVHDDRPTHDAASAETVTANYGQTVELECAIDLEGAISHSWAKHGGVLPSNAQVSGPRLTISSVTYKDAGLYICTASNGNVQVDIPKFILVRGAVPFFAQAKSSYLMLPTLSNGYLNFDIEITFKPESHNGLILYNGQQYGGAGDFISFGLRDGIPEFRFDVGSGVGLVRGSQPLSLGNWHTVHLNRVKKEGSMYVDEHQYYHGNSSGRMQGLDLSQPLFLGGVPDFSSIQKQNGFTSGFVGCISRLVINNKEDIDIMQEQKDSEGVTSCETCAVNPCMNSGVCQEAPTRSGYMCLCPRGFSGLNCSHMGEPCYPGACGQGRCVDTDEGLECYCGLGKAGDRCDRDISITEPSFNKNSYLAYPTPKTLSKIKIALKFNPADYSNGLLLYCAQNDDGTGDFVSLSIRDRHLEFKFDTGSGINTLVSMNEIVPGQWVEVNTGMGGRDAHLTVTGDLPVSKSVRSGLFKFATPLYIGGYDKLRIRPAAGVGVRQGFHGCVGEVQVSGLNLDLIRSVVDSANIEQCSTEQGDPCLLRPCLNNGVCYPGPDGRSYQCSCPSGFSGHNCEQEQDMCAALQPCQNGGSCVGTPSSYKCNCPIGFAGSNCQERTEFRTEVSFNGDGYVELNRDLLPHTNPEESELIHIEFSTTQPNGLLLWHGQPPETYGSGHDYLSVAVVNGKLELSYELGSKIPAVIVSTERVDDGARHAAEIKRQARDGSLLLDRGLTEFGESGGILTQLNTGGNIFIGGVPNLDHMTVAHGNLTNFVGCIHSLQIQNSGVINFAEKAVTSVNTRPCLSDAEDEDYDNNAGRGEEVH